MPRLFALFFVVAMLGLPFWWFENESHAPSARGHIVGVVQDDNGPVAGAAVRVKGRRLACISNAEGRFWLPCRQNAKRVTASKDGYFIAGAQAKADPLVLHLHRVPEQDCERYAWVDPMPDPRRAANCGNCHAAIHDEWQRSGHARSATNRRFLDLYDDLVNEHPLGRDVCSSCHSPTQKPGPFGSFDMRDAVNVSQGLSGVHCDFCHKIQGPASGEFGLTHGRYQLSLLRPDPDSKHPQLFLGPLDDVDRGDDIHSRFQCDSRLCAACHEGVVFGVPVYTTYSEWLDGPAARKGMSCQSCHMAPTGNTTNIAPGHGGIRRDPATLGNHTFYQGSQIDMLRRSLKLEASVRYVENIENDVEVRVSISTQNVGHRVPTGFIDRQVILFVEAYAGKELLTCIDGPLLPEALGKDEAKRPGRLYAKVLTDGKSSSPAPFWRADPATLLDTRLRPDETDRSTFVFPVRTDRVRIRLVHRRFWKTTAERKQGLADEEVIEEREVRP